MTTTRTTGVVFLCPVHHATAGQCSILCYRLLSNQLSNQLSFWVIIDMTSPSPRPQHSLYIHPHTSKTTHTTDVCLARHNTEINFPALDPSFGTVSSWKLSNHIGTPSRKQFWTKFTAPLGQNLNPPLREWLLVMSLRKVYDSQSLWHSHTHVWHVNVDN